jgi:hypothetical protein
MAPVGISAEECIHYLTVYCEAIQEIVALIENNNQISREHTEKAQELLKKLKNMFQQDYKSRDTRQGRQTMSRVEKTSFFPAIHEASTRIYVKTNSLPNEKWVMQLLDARSEIKYYLDGLRNKKETAG